MVTLIATLKIKEGKMEEAIEILKEMAGNIKASEPGTLEYIPHKVKGDDYDRSTRCFSCKVRQRQRI